MTREEAKRKMIFLKEAYQKLIDEGVDNGTVVGTGVRGTWKSDTTLTKAYEDMIDACDVAIKALEQEPVLDKIRAEINELPSYVAKFNGGDFAIHIDKEKVFEVIDKYKAESEDE